MNIELFGCSGGMAEGFRRAGVHFDLAIDRDPDACSSYAANLGHKPEQCDVNDFYREITVRDYPGIFGERKPTAQLWREYGAPSSWDVDLIVADPPCTPWSDGGKRDGLADPRDCMLVTVNIIRALRPACYLIGNVPGLGYNLDAQREILTPLRAAGYCTADFRLFDAANYGVPQRRRRPFWFGHLAGPCIRWPEPTHSDPRKLGLDLGVKPWVTCADALGHLPVHEIGEPVTLRWRADSDHRPSAWDEPGKTQTSNTHSDGALVIAGPSAQPRFIPLVMNSKHPPCEPDAPARTQTSRPAGGHSGGTLLVWPWNRPSTTVTTATHIGGAGRNGAKPGQGMWKTGIKLSEKARALLQGFPEDWTFHGKTQKSRAGQIGMAMPPPLAEAVARSVRKQMESVEPGTD